MVSTSKPHDAVFKAVFEHRDHAIGFLRAILPTSVTQTLSWSTLTRESSEFVAADLTDRHGDLLFKVQTHDRALRYLLLEHQSSLDVDMPLRMHVYQGQIWQRFRKQSADPLPPVIPVLVSHAGCGWTAPRNLAALLAMHPGNIELAPFVPDATMVVEDLQRLTNEDLDARALGPIPKLTLWLLRDARHGPRLRLNLPFWAHYFAEVLREPGGAQFVDLLLNYIALVCEHFSWEDFHATIHELAPEAEETIMTIAEELIAKGREEGLAKGLAKGREEGREEGRAELLSRQLQLKFGELPLELRSRLTTASLPELDTWAERVLFCASLDEVFAGSH